MSKTIKTVPLGVERTGTPDRFETGNRPVGAEPCLRPGAEAAGGSPRRFRKPKGRSGGGPEKLKAGIEGCSVPIDSQGSDTVSRARPLSLPRARNVFH